MTTRVLIVDDEAVARRRIRRLLAPDPDVIVVGECGDGASAVRAIAAERPDVAFLDVQMPELDGFDVVQAVKPSELPAVVFVTAFDQYALRAFDVHAIDYLLKPFTSERFRVALARARERCGRRDALAALVEQLRARPRYLARFAVRAADRTVLVDSADVDWMEAADNYVKLHVGAKEYLLRETLGGIEKRMNPAAFARIHRSAIVQIDRVAELSPATHGDLGVRLRDGTRLTLSRTFRDRLMGVMGSQGSQGSRGSRGSRGSGGSQGSRGSQGSQG
jgi:two-component system, LytTR family, response regulator